MNWTLHEDGIVRKNGQSACFAATAAEKEFWAEINRLKEENFSYVEKLNKEFKTNEDLLEELRAAKEKIQELERINEMHGQFYSLLKAKFEP